MFGEEKPLVEIPEEMKDGMVYGAEDEPEKEPAPVEKAAEKTNAPIYLGGKRFDSAEELALYAEELQNKTTRYEVERDYAPKPAVTKQKPTDLMFSDPDAYHRATLDEAEQRILGKIETSKKQESLWSNFYKNYKDLDNPDMQPIVETLFNKRKIDMANLPAEKVLDTIGKEARILVQKLRGKPEGGTELPSGTAKVASATNNIPSTKAVVQEEPESMLTAMRKLRKRGR